MPLAFVENISGVCCGVWNVGEGLDELALLLGNDCLLERIRGEVTSEKRLRERLLAVLLLRCITGKDYIVEHDECGRPYLQDENNHVSISHCPGYVAVAVAPFPLGVDIELVSDRQLNVADKFILPCEKSCLSEDNNTRKRAAALLWSVKEAVYKLAADKTLHMGSGIRVGNFILSDKGMVDAEIGFAPGVKTASASYGFFKNTVLVVSQYK